MNMAGMEEEKKKKKKKVTHVVYYDDEIDDQVENMWEKTIRTKCWVSGIACDHNIQQRNKEDVSLRVQLNTEQLGWSKIHLI